VEAVTSGTDGIDGDLDIGVVTTGARLNYTNVAPGKMTEAVVS